MPENFKHIVSTLNGGQKNFQQCWYASYKMLLAFHNQNTNTIEDKLTGAGIDVADAKSKGLIDKDFAKAGTTLGLKMWSGIPFKGAPGVFDVGLTDGCEAFLKELKQSPLWVSRYVGPGSYHIVVATGYNDTRDGYIHFNNPFPGPDHAREDTTLLANVFVKHITDAAGSVQAFR